MKILYLGDFAGASAEYLKDCLTELDHATTHFDAKQAVNELTEEYEVIILSDYPAKSLAEKATEAILDQVKRGARLLMIGGWDTFNGQGTNYADHPIGKILPVTLQEADDRVNAWQGLIITKDPATQSDLPIDWQMPPVVCGYNAFEAKDGAAVLVWMKPIQSDGQTVSLGQALPMVVKDSYEAGTVIACATDLAPHWAGGLVDWGNERRQFATVQVGQTYVQFARFLLEC